MGFDIKKDGKEDKKKGFSLDKDGVGADDKKSGGFDNLIDIEKGFKGIQDAGLKTTEYVCPTTML